MNGQVENILQMAMLEKESFTLNEQLLNINELIREVAGHFQFRIESRNGKLVLGLNADDPYLIADEIHLTSVLYNLLDNANKYSRSSPDISIHTQNEKDMIIISVRDHGIGMNTETQRQIFDKFFRGQNGNIHDVKGFGLGLPYVKTIIAKHGGKIRVKSEIGKGSCIEIILPHGHMQQSVS
jgi:two-component system phosphate regulon sensor histidine kinase PhoR